MPESTLHIIDDNYIFSLPPPNRCFLLCHHFLYYVSARSMLRCCFFLFDEITSKLEAIHTVIFFQYVSDWARHWFSRGRNSRLQDQKCNNISVIRDVRLCFVNPECAYLVSEFFPPSSTWVLYLMLVCVPSLLSHHHCHVILILKCLGSTSLQYQRDL